MGVDVLLIPVGVHILTLMAAEIVGKISPSVVIPMHFKTDRINFPSMAWINSCRLWEKVPNEHQHIGSYRTGFKAKVPGL